MSLFIYFEAHSSMNKKLDYEPTVYTSLTESFFTGANRFCFRANMLLNVGKVTTLMFEIQSKCA